MAIYKYLCDMVQSREDPSASEPRIAYELPDLNWGMQEYGSLPGIPFGRVLVTVNCDSNADRAITAIPNVSKYT